MRKGKTAWTLDAYVAALADQLAFALDELLLLALEDSPGMELVLEELWRRDWTAQVRGRLGDHAAPLRDVGLPDEAGIELTPDAGRLWPGDPFECPVVPLGALRRGGHLWTIPRHSRSM